MRGLTTTTKKSRCQKISLNSFPPLMEKCFSLLRESGADCFALFGGAVRDTHRKCDSIKDYDVRIWFSNAHYDQLLTAFLKKLEEKSGQAIQIVPAPGTTHVRYCFHYCETEIDISVRPAPKEMLLPEFVAIDRATACDVGISAAAIDSNGQVWAMPEFLTDHEKKTLTVYPSDNQARITQYIERMQKKFPDHPVIFLKPSSLTQYALFTEAASTTRNPPVDLSVVPHKAGSSR